MTTRADLAPRYAVALSAYLAGGSEETLLQAYDFGRAALADGFGLLDIALMHHEVLATLLTHAPPAEARRWMDPAAQFLAECLSPFEMSLTGYREQSERLAAANAELETAHAKLIDEIAERERAEEALRQTQRLQSIGQLSGGIAHHFNNLLTVVIGNIHMARRRVEGDPKLERLLDSAAIGAERGAAVTKQLLAFSRRQMLKPEVIDPSIRLEETAALMNGALSGAITIETDIPHDLWPIQIDPTELDLALINLGLNARDAMGGGGRLRVAASNRQVKNPALGLDGDFVTVEVSDTGAGIAPENLPRVFDPFFTTKGGGGTGLGLSQVHGFAHQSGGAVEIESVVGKGATVRLYLPAANRETDAGAIRDEAAPEEAPSAKGTVLVVDDDEGVASLAAALLEDSGFRVKLAYRARTALDLLRRDPSVDLVFSDIVMPDGMDGIALAEEVRRLRPDLPILLTSGYSEAIADGRAEARGFPILPKPYRPTELRRGVLALLDKAA